MWLDIQYQWLEKLIIGLIIGAISLVLLFLFLWLLRKFFKGAQFREKVDVTGKVAVVTGANTGIGLETVKHINKEGAKVYMLCRNEKKAREAIDYLVKKGCTESRLFFEKCDLASFDSVRDCASSILQKEKVIDILVNNAGVFCYPKYEKTRDGHEMTWQSNHLAPFLLTELLLPSILRSSDPRIVNVSFINHYWSKPLDLSTIDDEASYGVLAPYNRSKLANVMYTRELYRRLKLQGHTHILVNAVHPGLVDTTMSSENILFVNKTPFRQILYPLGLLVKKTPKDGAQTVIFLALSRKLKGVSGKYFVKDAWNLVCSSRTPFLLTELLLPSILRSSEPRIVNVSSINHFWSKPLDLSSIDDEASYGVLALYNRSKLANVMYTRELSRRLGLQGHTHILVNAVHPGLVDTTMSSENILFVNKTPFRQILYPLGLLVKKTPKDGAQTLIFLALSRKLKGVSGKYFVDCQQKRAAPLALDDEACQTLFDYSLKEVGLNSTGSNMA